MPVKYVSESSVHLDLQCLRMVLDHAQGVVKRLTFGWVTPLLARGLQRPLQQDDLFQLQATLMPSACSKRLWVRFLQK